MASYQSLTKVSLRDKNSCKIAIFVCRFTLLGQATGNRFPTDKAPQNQRYSSKNGIPAVVIRLAKAYI